MDAPSSAGDLRLADGLWLTWWHHYLEPVRLGREPGSVRFLPGRIKFGGAKNSAPFPSVVVIFGPTRREPAEEKAQSAA